MLKTLIRKISNKNYRPSKTDSKAPVTLCITLLVNKDNKDKEILQLYSPLYSTVPLHSLYHPCYIC